MGAVHRAWPRGGVRTVAKFSAPRLACRQMFAKRRPLAFCTVNTMVPHSCRPAARLFNGLCGRSMMSNKQRVHNPPMNKPTAPRTPRKSRSLAVDPAETLQSPHQGMAPHAPGMRMPMSTAVSAGRSLRRRFPPGNRVLVVTAARHWQLRPAKRCRKAVSALIPSMGDGWFWSTCLSCA